MAEILIVTGATATGKTTLARSLSDILKQPLLTKDTYKECLFDQLGSGSLEWSRKLGATSFELLWLTSFELAKAGVSHILDYPTTSSKFLDKRCADLRRRLSVTIGVLELIAVAEVRKQRFRERILSGERHHGHPEGVESELDIVDVANISCHIGADASWIIDTSEISLIPFEDILRWVKRLGTGNRQRPSEERGPISQQQ